MTQPLRVTIHQAGSGVCSLSGKNGDGLTVTFDDGTVTQQHLSWKGFRQVVAMKTAQTDTKSPAKSGPVALPPLPVAVGSPVTK